MYCEQAIAKLSTSGIAIIGLLHSYSRQCGTNGFLAIAWLLVSYMVFNLNKYSLYLFS